MVRDLATVAVVPRERFSLTRRSLETLLDHTEPGVELIYIDGGSPPEVRDYLERRSAERKFRLIRTNDYLAPNVARNMALAHVRTKYVVFVDNDAIVSPGWLAPLVDCAEATGALGCRPGLLRTGTDRYADSYGGGRGAHRGRQRPPSAS